MQYINISLNKFYSIHGNLIMDITCTGWIKCKPRAIGNIPLRAHTDYLRKLGHLTPLTLLLTDIYFFESANQDKYYPSLSFMIKNLKAKYHDNYHIFDKVYKTEKHNDILNEFIIAHNLLYVKNSLWKWIFKRKKKNRFMRIRARNTPGLIGVDMNIFHTPLRGSLYDFYEPGAWTIYSKWITSSYYLFLELNILNKVLICLNNKALNLPVTVQEESAFNFLQSRVISKQSYKYNDLLFKKQTYVMDSSVDSPCMCIEVMEYLLCVLYNLSLSQKILNNMVWNKDLNPAIGRFASWSAHDGNLCREFIRIINDFNRENEDVRDFIRELRLYWLNNYFTGQDFKDKAWLSSTLYKYLT